MSTEITNGYHLRLQPLTYVEEGDGIIVGRPDTGSYGVFPPDGAELLRRLDAGDSLGACAEWWHHRTGEKLDLDDFRDTLDDLGFLVGENERRVEPSRVRWHRLSRWLFSPFAWFIYAAIVAVGLAAMGHDPGLRPSYRSIFFTSNIAVVSIALALGQLPLLLLHEGYHALAARRLGLPSTLGVGRRFYYIVAETRLNSLYSVPRGKRYLPFFAGALVDTVGVFAFTLLCAAARALGAPSWLSGLALAFAFSGILRVLWQFLFYLETDFYFVVKTATRCDDLHGAAVYRLRTRLATVLRRPTERSDAWSDHDLAMARWYAPLMLVGYGLSLGTLILVGLPTAWQFWTTVLHRFDGSEPQTVGGVIDTIVFCALSITEFVLLGYVTVRDRRNRGRARSAGVTEPPNDSEFTIDTEFSHDNELSHDTERNQP